MVIVTDRGAGRDLFSTSFPMFTRFLQMHNDSMVGIRLAWKSTGIGRASRGSWAACSCPS